MSTQILTSPEIPVAVNGGTVKNHGPGTVFYSDELPVTSAVNDGSIASGSTATLSSVQWLIASEASSVVVTPPNPVPVSGYSAPNVRTASYTLTLADANNVVEINSASNLTVTVPLESNVAFPYGTVIEIGRYGAGTVTIAGEGGVTLRSPGDLLDLRAQYSTLTLRKRGTDEWWVAGDVA